MKLALGPLGAILVGAVAMSFGAGCAASAAPRGPAVGTTELSSVTFMLSRLAPATWDGDEARTSTPAGAPAKTWGAVDAPANAPAPAPELMSTP